MRVTNLEFSSGQMWPPFLSPCIRRSMAQKLEDKVTSPTVLSASIISLEPSSPQHQKQNLIQAMDGKTEALELRSWIPGSNLLTGSMGFCSNTITSRALHASKLSTHLTFLTNCQSDSEFFRNQSRITPKLMLLMRSLIVMILCRKATSMCLAISAIASVPSVFFHSIHNEWQIRLHRRSMNQAETMLDNMLWNETWNTSIRRAQCFCLKSFLFPSQ